MGCVETMKVNSKVAEFEAEALARLARIRSGGRTFYTGCGEKAGV